MARALPGLLALFVLSANVAAGEWPRARASAISPRYHWQVIQACASGAVVARSPLIPGRLAIVRDLGCAVDHVAVDGRRQPLEDVLGMRVAVWAIPLEWPAGARPVDVCEPAGCRSAELTVGDAAYPLSEITVARRYETVSASDRRRIERERERVASSTQVLSLAPFWGGAFALPRRPDYTSVFGAERVINGKQRTRHLGTDFDGKIGDPVSSAQTGVVVLAEELFYSGRTIFVSHGLGLFTSYFHLDSLVAKVGDLVEPGAPLGTVGRSGRVTGPHLHFAAKLDGTYFDPDELFELQLWLDGSEP